MQARPLNRPRAWLIGCGVPLLVYFAAAIPLAWSSRERINPDAVAYLRQAEYLADGQGWASVSAYWSPLLSWCVVPLVKLGLDPLYAARAVLTVWGAGFVVAMHVFLRRLARWPLWSHTAALSTIALAILPGVMRWITPDLMFSTLLFAHFAAMWHPRLLRSRKRQLFAGVLAGTAFLAKSFALPFAIVHLVVLLIVRAKLHGRWRPMLSAGGFVIMGLMLIAGPWIAVISAKFGQLTTGSSAAAARALVAPESAGGGRLQHGRPRDPALAANPFTPPPDPLIAWWETPDVMRHRFWSPFEDEQLLRHQRKLILTQTRKGLRIIGEFDELSVGRLLLLSPLMLLVPTVLRRGRKARLLWGFMAIILYCGPFLLVYLVDRYLIGIVLPLLLIMGIVLTLSIAPRGRAKLRVVRSLVVAILCGSFGVTAIRQMAEMYANAPGGEFRELAAQLNARYPEHTLVSPDFGPGMYTAYFAGRKFVAITSAGLPGPDGSPAERERLLGEAAVRPLVLIWSQPERKDSEAVRQLARDIVETQGWKHVWTCENQGTQVQVYRKADR